MNKLELMRSDNKREHAVSIDGKFQTTYKTITPCLLVYSMHI